MPLLPSSNVQPMILYGMGVICLCVLMYALGTTMTLWNLEFQLDPVNGPLLEGFSIPATVSNPQPSPPTPLFAESSNRMLKKSASATDRAASLDLARDGEPVEP